MQLTVSWCFLQDEAHLVPPDAALPAIQAPDIALLPNQHDVVLISPRSAWLVIERVFQQVSPQELLVQMWLGHCPEALVMRKRPPPALAPGPSTAPHPPG